MLLKIITTIATGDRTKDINILGEFHTWTGIEFFEYNQLFNIDYLQGWFCLAHCCSEGRTEGSRGDQEQEYPVL